MTAKPLFIKDLDTLQARLRLSAVDDGDAVAVINSVVEEVRIGFYTELGASRVAEIVALTEVAEPVTDDGITKLRAVNIELLWVRVTLMRRLPMLFVQGSGQTRKAWNEEGITRDARDTSNYRSEIKHLERLVVDGLAWLGGTETGLIVVSVIEPDVAPPKPGESVFGIANVNGLVPIVFENIIMDNVVRYMSDFPVSVDNTTDPTTVFEVSFHALDLPIVTGYFLRMHGHLDIVSSGGTTVKIRGSFDPGNYTFFDLEFTPDGTNVQGVLRMFSDWGRPALGQTEASLSTGGDIVLGPQVGGPPGVVHPYLSFDNNLFGFSVFTNVVSAKIVMTLGAADGTLVVLDSIYAEFGHVKAENLLAEPA